MKKIITLVLLFSVLFTFAGCGEDTEKLKEKEYISKSTQTAEATIANPTNDNKVTATNIPTVTSTITLTPTPEKKLSRDCDKVLASGYDKDNNFYELVANEHEDYSGTTIEMGVIKNNKWSIPLTTRTPFIGENGLLSCYSGKESAPTGSIYDKKFAIFEYIGAGCFYFNYDIWNGDSGDFYDAFGQYDYVPVFKRKNKYINNEGTFVLEKWGKPYKILNTNTMTITDTNLNPTEYCFPYSEGLFACMDKYFDKQTNGFYDINGNKVIDLSNYILAKHTYKSSYKEINDNIKQDLVFKNGKCTFKIENDQGSYYNITIDKTGKVVNSEKIE